MVRSARLLAVLQPDGERKSQSERTFQLEFDGLRLRVLNTCPTKASSTTSTNMGPIGYMLPGTSTPVFVGSPGA